MVWDVWPLSHRGFPAAQTLALKYRLLCVVGTRLLLSELTSRPLKPFHYHTRTMRENKQGKDIDERYSGKGRYFVYYN